MPLSPVPSPRHPSGAALSTGVALCTSVASSAGVAPLARAVAAIGCALGTRTVARLALVASHGSLFALLLSLCLVRLLVEGPDARAVATALDRAEAALGGRYELTLRRASWTVAGGTLAVALDGLALEPTGRGPGLRVRRAVAGLGLPGTGVLRSLALDGVEPAFGAARPGPIDLAPLEAVLREGLAPAMARLRRLGLRRIELTDIRPPRGLGRGPHRRLDRPFAFPLALSLEEAAAGYRVAATLRVRDARVPVAGTLSPAGELSLAARDVPLSRIWSAGAFHTDAPVAAVLSAGPGSAATLDLSLGPAPVRVGAETAAIDGAEARAVLDGGGLRIVRARGSVGANAIDATGRATLHRNAEGAPVAAFDLAGETVLAPADIDAAPLPLAARATGSIDFRARVVALDRVEANGEATRLAGTARFGLRGTTPSVRLDVAASEARATDLATLWPSWIAHGARDWIAGNVTDGRLADARLAVDLAPGRIGTLDETPLRADELQADASVSGGATRLFGELPPLTEADARVALGGTRLMVDLERGTTGNPLAPVPLARSSFALLDTADAGLPARFDLALSGTAAALGALADARPIGALAAAGFAPDELEGRASGRLSGTVMLREPERRDWALALDLDRVALLRALEGRRIGDLTGRLSAGPSGVTLSADGLLDGLRARFDLAEPITAEPVALPVPEMSRRRRVAMTLDRAGLRALAPGLADLVDGPVEVEASVEGERALVSVDLRRAAVALPWLGWRKGSGIAATARFVATQDGERIAIDDLVVEGRGFGARGSARIDADGLRRLALDRAALSSGDDVALTVERRGGRWLVDATGARFDGRALLATLDPRGGRSGDGDGPRDPVTVTASIGTVRGHGGVEAQGVRVRYETGGAGMAAVEMRGRIGRRQVVVDGGANDVFVTTDDLGSALRFLDIYGRVEGGVLTASLARRDGAWRGEVAASDVTILDEPKLRVMASKVSRRGRIDGSRVRLSRASVEVAYANGAIALTDGLVRGPEVGATFAGTLVDAAGRIALTGTFLPAYGLNRIFGEVPLIGAVLGNGRDKGLVGITFRLSGNAKRPQIEVNPLSALAPGVLRRIFEYR